MLEFLFIFALIGLGVIFILGLILLTHSNSLKGRLVGLILLVCLGLTLWYILTLFNYSS